MFCFTLCSGLRLLVKMRSGLMVVSWCVALFVYYGWFLLCQCKFVFWVVVMVFIGDDLVVLFCGDCFDLGVCFRAR